MKNHRAPIQFMTFIIFWLLSPQAYSIVNVEDIHLGKPNEGYGGTVLLGVDGDQGNTDRFRGHFGSRIQHVGDDVTRFIALNLDYGESRGVEDKNRSFLHARQISIFRADMAWEIFAQAEHNRFSRLAFRGLAGGGLRFGFGEEKQNRITYLGAGAFFSQESLEKVAGTNDDAIQNITRANLYLVHKQKIGDKLTLFSTTYMQPSFEDPGDFRLLEDAGLSLGLSDRLSLVLTLNLFHDNLPPQTVKKTDISYKTSIAYRF